MSEHEGPDFTLPAAPERPERIGTLRDLVSYADSLQKWCEQVATNYKVMATMYADAHQATQAALRQQQSIEAEYINLSNAQDAIRREQETQGLMFNQFAVDYVSIHEKLLSLVEQSGQKQSKKQKGKSK